MQVLITGANGKIGRMLRLVWVSGASLPFKPVWCSRKALRTTDVIWDIESGFAPPIAQGAVVLHLAGVVRGDPAALHSNSAMALKVCAAAKDAGARHVLLASTAAVYGASDTMLVETHAPAPRSDYGRAKLLMERNALCWGQNAGPDAPGVSCLRIGNVLGADALIGQTFRGQNVVLDPAPDSARGPLRSYLGPQYLARILAALLGKLAQGADLPPILNIAAREQVYMADLLTAAEVPFHFGSVNPDVIPKVCLSTKRLAKLVGLPAMGARAIVADWQDVMGRAA